MFQNGNTKSLCKTLSSPGLLTKKKIKVYKTFLKKHNAFKVHLIQQEMEPWKTPLFLFHLAKFLELFSFKCTKAPFYHLCSVIKQSFHYFFPPYSLLKLTLLCFLHICKLGPFPELVNPIAAGNRLSLKSLKSGICLGAGLFSTRGRFL